jgi:hypothetical protein
MSEFKDLTDQKFDRLTVISYAGRKNGHSFWNCVCDCGNKKIIRRELLLNGKVKSCGCLYREVMEERQKRTKNIVGKKFGKLNVLERLDYKGDHGCSLFLCKCDCGKFCIIKGIDLNSNVKSCGCLKNENLSRSKSGCKNVYWINKNKKWSVMFYINGKNKCFGRFNEDLLNDAIDLANKLRPYYQE